MPATRRRPGPGGTVPDVARAPDRLGFFRSLPLPSRTEGIVITVLFVVTALALGVAAWQASNRTPPVFTPAENAAVSAGATSSAPGELESTPPGPAGTPVLAFYGDRYVAETEQGGAGRAGWPAIVSERIGAEGTEPHAVPDAGYVAVSDFSGDTFLTLAQRLPEPDADVTVVFGSRNDLEATPAQITTAATRTIEAIREAAPQTRLLVIGPVWPDADVPRALLPARDAVRQAAAAAGVTFVDPLALRWFVDDRGLIGEDLISPNDEGHAYLADQIEPFVRDLLEDVDARVPSGTASNTP